MLGVYYRIWVDCIRRARSQPANKKNWLWGSMLIMTTAMAFNFTLVMVVFQQYITGYFFYRLNLDFLPSKIDFLLNFIILFFLPSGCLNYFLIVRNRRYEKLLEKYPYYNGKLILTYFGISIALPIVLVWIFL
jgi:hypothetical protein